MAFKAGYKIKSLITIGLGGTLMFGVTGFYKNNETFYKEILMPMARKLDPETAHRLGIMMAKHKLYPQAAEVDCDILKTSVIGFQLASPIGLAAGFDKDGEAVTGLFRMGFSFVEVGSVTPQPQPGNSKPRLFRLLEDKAVINRYGFNSAGHIAVKQNLKQREHFDGKILGVNLGKNKTSQDSVDDYVKGVECFGGVADFLVINVSSPNTPGLRNMQNKKELERLLEKVLGARDKLNTIKRTPVLLKISPDMTESELKDVATVVLQKKIDGLIVSNTTTSRSPDLKSPLRNEEGGLSGQPIRDISTKVIKDMYRLTKGKIPIIGVGGISCGHDAYDKIRAGASLVELYTSLVYEGPPIVTKIKRELADLLRNDKFSSISEAVGVDTDK